MCERWSGSRAVVAGLGLGLGLLLGASAARAGAAGTPAPSLRPAATSVVPPATPPGPATTVAPPVASPTPAATAVAAAVRACNDRLLALEALRGRLAEVRQAGQDALAGRQETAETARLLGELAGAVSDLPLSAAEQALAGRLLAAHRELAELLARSMAEAAAAQTPDWDPAQDAPGLLEALRELLLAGYDTAALGALEDRLAALGVRGLRAADLNELPASFGLDPLGFVAANDPSLAGFNTAMERVADASARLDEALLEQDAEAPLPPEVLDEVDGVITSLDELRGLVQELSLPEEERQLIEEYFRQRYEMLQEVRNGAGGLPGTEIGQLGDEQLNFLDELGIDLGSLEDLLGPDESQELPPE